MFPYVQYGIKKKEEPAEPVNDPTLEGRLGRKKKDPSELEAEANGEAPNGEAASEWTPNLWLLLSQIIVLHEAEAKPSRLTRPSRPRPRPTRPRPGFLASRPTPGLEV